MIIHKGSEKQISPFFKEKEFFSKCPDYTGLVHDLDVHLIESADILREYTGYPVIITSSHRTVECNRKAGGAPDSWHMRDKAIDLMCTKNWSKVAMEIALCEGVFLKLLLKGIRGFGVGGTYLHIDTRDNARTYSFLNIKYDLWYYS
jgi:uncharacterized protein YcbK (DUF882 family)